MWGFLLPHEKPCHLDRSAAKWRDPCIGFCCCCCFCSCLSVCHSERSEEPAVSRSSPLSPMLCHQERRPWHYDQEMSDFRFQLVFQFEATRTDSQSTLIELMESIEQHLQDESEVLVDGFDVGQGEFNIFIHTNEPVRILDRTASFIRLLRPPSKFSAGYRAFSDDDYTPLFPPGKQTFTVQ
jgi:hypothetical protein